MPTTHLRQADSKIGATASSWCADTVRPQVSQDNLIGLNGAGYALPSRPCLCLEKWLLRRIPLLREYFPKDIEITRGIRYLQAAADEIDDRPRVILGFRTSAEVFAEFLADNPGDNVGSIAFRRLRSAIQKGPEK